MLDGKFEPPHVGCYGLGSPCNQICRLDNQDICLGCRRTRMEIARWTQMDDAEKSAVWAALEKRRGKPHGEETIAG